MYIDKYWGNFIGGSDDSLNLVAFLEDQKKEEIPLSEIFAKIGLDKQNWDFHQTVEYLEFTHSNGVEIDFHFAIDVVTDLAAILLECSVSGGVNLHDLDEYNTPSRRIRVTATAEEHDAMDKALADFAQAPLSYDLHDLMGDEEIEEMAHQVAALRKELYESAGRNRSYHVKAEDMKNLLPDWAGADGCIATNRITVEGCKVGYCYREEPDGDWDSGWRFTAGDESDDYMDDPNNAGLYKLNTICNDDSDIIPLLNTPAPCAFERDEHGVFQPIKDWKPQNEEEPDMDILQQCQRWHETDEYQKIIDALEAIPAEERTPEMDSELARAYNNLADPNKPGGKDMLKKAIALLKPHEEYFEGDHYWNFRMGYSYYYLDQGGRALPYFHKALEARPDDEDTKRFIEWCEADISRPWFSMCFRERTENWWETFAEMEAELRQMMDEDKNHTRGAELVAQMEETLNLAFDEISFELGVGGEKHELILTPEGDKVKLFELVYFQKHAPKEVLEHWNILVGRQPVQNIGLRTNDGWEISGDDVQIWLEEQGENSFAISAYCEKLLPKLQEEEGRAWWMLTTLTDQVLGEISHMRYIDSFDVLEEPRAEPSILMSQLPDALKQRGLELSTDPEAYLKSYLSYQMEPNQDPDADWRLDVMAGSTNCVPLINGYLNADNDSMDALHADGAVAGFFCYPLDTLREEEGSEKIFDFRDKLEEVFTTGDGPEVLTLTGGATGLYFGYVDFIAWDIRTALRMAKKFFENSDVPWASFHTFRREAGSVYLKQEDTPDDDGVDTPAGETLQDEESGVPEVYTEEEMEAIEGHIQKYFGTFENVFHELVSPDIHVDICMVPPTEERDYCTLVTMGMGAHRMNVPEELVEYKLERAELAIALPADWKLDQESMKDEKWYWPIRLLKSLARLPIASDTWLGFGHTMDNEEDFAENTKLCAAILTGPQGTKDGSEVCTLPGGEEVNFYQVIPLYEDELDYKLEHDVDALLDKMAGISFVVNPTRQDAITRGTLSNDDFDGEMDDASYHIESIEEKELPIDPINAYNHMAIYLRWCMEHDLMSEDFLKEYSEVTKQVKMCIRDRDGRSQADCSP